MRHSNVSNNQGFTVLEALIVAVFAGILVAMAGPSYFAWSQRRAVDSAITSIEGAIKEAQRQAMARSQTCNVTFNSTTITSSPANCLITGDRTLSNVSMQISINDTSLTTDGATPISFNFNHLGVNLNTNNVTFVVNHSSNSNLRRCLVVSTPLGLIATGNYTEPSGAISARCTNRKDLII